MLRVGLTGGIGSGKSTVARRLGELGAMVIDADVVAREIMEPGQPVLEQVRERFGDEVIRADGTLDRAGLAVLAIAGCRNNAVEPVTQARAAISVVSCSSSRARVAKFIEN